MQLKLVASSRFGCHKVVKYQRL